MVDSSYSQRSLNYYRKRQCSPQWQAFLGPLFTELAASSGTETMLDFFHHLGGRMARRMPIAEQDTLEGLELAVNEQWAAIDWGWCQFSASGDVISIVHGAWPHIPCEQPSLAASAIGAVVCGAYEHWLKEQGGGPVHVMVLRAEWDRVLELCYGG